MKVAITLNTSWNIFNFRMGLIRALIEKGNQVIAIAPKDAYSEKIQQAGCTFVALSMDNTGSNPMKDFFLFWKLRKIYGQYQPDIVLHYTVKPNIYGTLAARTLGIPSINNVSGLGTVFLSSNMTSAVAKILYKLAFSRTQLVFFQNHDDRQNFLSQINLPKLQTSILPGSGINLSSFQATAYKPSTDRTFLMIARLIVDKGVLEYIEAAKVVIKKYPKAKFQLLGKLEPTHVRGISRKTIAEASKSGTIEYLGETENVRPYIENVACVVLPSYREGTPRTMLEASAMARPVITTNVAGCREVVIDEETGLLCQAKSASDLADKMMTICKMADSALETWGANGRRLIEGKFDEQIVIGEYLKHASNIINQISNE